MTNSDAVTQADLRRVSRVAIKLTKTKAELKQAILLARASGETYADIASAAGLTAQRVHQIVRDA